MNPTARSAPRKWERGGIMPTIPAILNAVSDAVGVRINELPLTPERVCMVIKEAKKGGKK